jgi:hypothetical protein
VNELKLLLNNPKLTREQDKKREIIKKVRPCARLFAAPSPGARLLCLLWMTRSFLLTARVSVIALCVL